jgi:DNA-binding response OmpR family regulator
MAASLNIIVVEDHDSLREVMVAILTDAGHQAVGLASAEALDDEVGGRVADIYLIDINLPGENGISLSARIRRTHPQVGIILVTARLKAQDKVDGYGSGADLYLTKPVGPDELLAAVNALARRVKPEPSGPLPVLELDRKRLLLSGALQQIDVSEAEASILSALGMAAGQSLEYWQLHETLGQLVTESSQASLVVRMTRLRKKLALASGDEAAIKAIRGRGYQLCCPLRLG